MFNRFLLKHWRQIIDSARNCIQHVIFKMVTSSMCHATRQNINFMTDGMSKYFVENIWCIYTVQIQNLLFECKIGKYFCSIFTILILLCMKCNHTNESERSGWHTTSFYLILIRLMSLYVCQVHYNWIYVYFWVFWTLLAIIFWISRAVKNFQRK